ncbi:glutamate synthase subunit alpha [Anabaena cylindrica FACHB-243]|uniref:glutamate synthase (ferredoxin) n=1 Tax=Anabaena cylindrica (strain ATCC 27899 / PCC 7122) TaxID=272123 RepID=K9ZFE6_ANACC|nr:MULTISPECIES: glutamate synthase-related protein [Anabaena]AFZ57943.1 Glutamate synthase (ferredoxin) [Anabaena cylindrica PCC 7122]MBD2419702.1 glutamate synthase subunit alpha [Anabaena cylindrica FACHB-243]MBY5281595.1 glutamate synthase subunit alpha [Anabaena sp. CCAP 1446/1C]MBY5307152.1 glutamate synthase subunit alpha [Anabaena sp. CCAP 1446/1C]MCM2409222.1 glutamate synthase-related protein [Anabaena sp. CCAP 1446/1C]
MNHQQLNQGHKNTLSEMENKDTFQGQKWLVEERDACGVGFIAHRQNSSSHEILAKALTALTCLEHRGGCSADQDSGDGAGILTAIPWELFQQEGIDVANTGKMAVGMIFLPQDQKAAQQAKAVFEQVAAEEKFTVLGWRVVPVRSDVLGLQAKENQPQIEQVFLASADKSGDELERELYITRRRIVKAAKNISEEFYVCSLSVRTIVYKGMVRSSVLGEFYEDLKNPAFKIAFAVYHRRFSTNTMPKWPLAQPMRLLGHNGEINTLLGNINWMMAREATLDHPVWNGREDEFKPLVNIDSSDSATLDNVLELLVRSGRSPLEALMMMVPEAYKNQPSLQNYPEIVDFYEYYSGLQEAWDGPALLVFSDGKRVGATLDRNGLRPARYVITKDDYIVVASEAGVIEFPEADILEKGRLGPGQMIAVDLSSNEILKNWEIKQRIANLHPYGDWLQQHRQELKQLVKPSVANGNGNGHHPTDDGHLTAEKLDKQTLLQQQIAFGYTTEDVEMVIQPMANTGAEPTFCMGDDIPLAVLSEKPHLLYDYFKQRFAQVTNPPIDPLREKLVMSLTVELGERGNLLDPQPEHARRLKLESPVLTESELTAIKLSGFATAELSTLFSIAAGPNSLKAAVEALQQQAAESVRAGAKILILSDKIHPTLNQGEKEGISAEYTYIPPLLAVGAVHHYLIREGVRMKTSLVVHTAQCWSTHHFACLLGYGAGAVCPYMALDTVRDWWSDPKTQQFMQRGKINNLTLEQAIANYRQAVESGLLKILSKMGISLLSSYQAAQIFEAIGIGGDLLALGFWGTTSRIGGLSCSELAQEVLSFHSKGFPELSAKKLENLGFVQYRPGGEYHSNSPELVKALHKAVDGKNYDHYEVYKQHLQSRPATALRDLLDFTSDRSSIPIEEVESVSEIAQRFCTGGMSLGALSREAHETLAIAMNRIGGKSNSGEGGEDPVRYKVLNDVDATGHSPTLPHLNGLRNGDTASSAIKQVASGRFGVTPGYLASAKQIEIKIAQGAKPGEGGQLPGPKVSPYIAMLRRSKPGVTLISPPPHHDIYSIEDLAQLIFDLHQINPKAQVSVKLVAEIGIGTIAAGVAKANADIIQISGHDGGTGASPLSSIKHAGSPWELGLSEVHRVLMENGLRDRVTLRVDGGLKSGWDVLVGALMGAEEFGFGSIAMIAEGCIMARVCHLNTCPKGVATQKEELRQRFTGIPENVVNFFYFVAEEVRSLLAKLGYRSLTELTGRADLFTVRSDVKLNKTQALNLDCLTKLPDAKQNRSWLEHEKVHSNGSVLDDQILADTDIQAAISNQSTISKTFNVVNTDRTVGSRLAGAIASQYGDSGFEGQINLNFQGSIGQSFGAFNLPGLTLTLTGEANDYVGKGMHGGEIIIKPPANANYDPSQNVIVGNTCLYGATGGVLFANGLAGERFAVRNSKGTAVIEGAGDHCCEYMTGGVIVVLGKVGRNVGAGMTGGLGYFLDEDGAFPELVNKAIVKTQRVVTETGAKQLYELIKAHSDRTNSPKAQLILQNWEEFLPKFWQLVPPSESDSPEANPEATSEQKQLSSV